MAEDGRSGVDAYIDDCKKKAYVEFLAPALFLFIIFFQPSSAAASSSGTLKDENVKVEYVRKEQCDVFSGKWVPDASGPAYTNVGCHYIHHKQNCLWNGRPDRGYLHWRWEPYACHLPRLDAHNLLNAIRHKSLAFVGDSIVRNQMESLLCLLSEVDEAQLVYIDKRFHSKTWYLPSHNITMGLIWAPFLVNSTESHSSHNIQIWLDALDATWTSQYHKYDCVLLAGGQWFLKDTVFWENDTMVGCHNCPPGMNLKELGSGYSYRKALSSALRFMATSHHKPLIILRTWSPDHFEHGRWDTGGVCNRTQPFNESEYVANPIDAVMTRIELEEFEEGLQSGLNIKLLDTYHLSLLRPDAHPGPYTKFHPDLKKRPQNDCLHWCLPGSIDTWNNLFAELLLNDASTRGPQSSS